MSIVRSGNEFPCVIIAQVLVLVVHGLIPVWVEKGKVRIFRDGRKSSGVKVKTLNWFGDSNTRSSCHWVRQNWWCLRVMIVVIG